MTPLQKQKVEALRKVRVALETHYGFICLHLHEIENTNPRLSRAARELIDYIGKQLEPHLYLGTWIAANREDLRLSVHHRNQYRIEWVDWMVRCLEGTEP